MSGKAVMSHTFSFAHITNLLVSGNANSKIIVTINDVKINAPNT